MDDWLNQYDAIMAMNKQYEATKAVYEAVNSEAIKAANGQYDALKKAIEALGPFANDLTDSYRSGQRQLEEIIRLYSVNTSTSEYLNNLNRLAESQELGIYQSQIDATRAAVQSSLEPFLLSLAASGRQFGPNDDSYTTSFGKLNLAIAKAAFVGEITLQGEEEEQPRQVAPGRGEKEEGNPESGKTDSAVVEAQLVDVIPEGVLRDLKRVEFLPLTMLNRILRDPTSMRLLDPRDFERFVATLIDQLGFEDVVITPRSGDQGRDVIATKRVHGIPILFAFECKRYAESNSVGPDIVRALLGTVVHRGTRANKGVLVTTSSLSPAARKFILTEPLLEGRDFEDIVEWLREYSRLSRNR